MLLPKILLPAATAATGLGLALLSPQDPPAPPATAPAQTIEVANVEATGDEDSDALTDLYTRLRKIRSERLVDQPKKLSDDAAKIYREALAATEKKDDAKAKALTEAARELIHALELSLNSRDKGPEDPDLPPPPSRTTRRVYVYRTDGKATTLPPVIDGEVKARVLSVPVQVDGVKTTKTVRVLSDAKDVTAVGNVQLQVADGKPTPGNVQFRVSGGNTEGTARDIVVKNIEGNDAKVIELHGIAVNNAKVQEEVARVQAEHARAIAVQAHNKVADALHTELKALKTKEGEARIAIELKNDDHEAVNVLKLAEAKAKLHESLAGVRVAQDGKNKLQLRITTDQGKDGVANADEAVSQLQKAYEAVVKARKEKKGESAHYLDAARELYNAAHRAAEAKQFDRAAELARAAEALTKVEHTLGNVHLETHIVTDGNKEEKKVLRYELKPGDLKGGLTIKSDNIKTKDGVFTIKSDDVKNKDSVITLHSGDGKAHEGIVTLKPGEMNRTTGVFTIKPDDIKVHGGTFTIKPDETTKTETRKIEVRVDNEKKAEDGEHRIQLKLADPVKVEGEKKADGGEHRIQLKLADPVKVEGQKTVDDSSVQGIGVMITFEDGKAQVNDLVKGGPAEQDGKIKSGDVIIGVVKENGATVGFGDKSLEDVTKLLRGPVGSKVSVLVQPKGTTEFKTIVIERKKLDLPKPADAEKPAAPKPGGTNLPPIID